MTFSPHPPHPLPPALRGAEKGSFAEYTVKQRFPDTVERVLADNDFPPPAAGRLRQLLADIPHAPLRPIADGAADNLAWQAALSPFLAAKATWLSAPWLPAEIYLYRRILEASGFFVDGATRGRDPFQSQKNSSLRGSAEKFEALCAAAARDLTPEGFAHHLQLALWGNQADLSLFPAGSEQPEHADEEVRRAHTLVDDTAALWRSLSARPLPLPRVDFLLDNAGFELLGDLSLADFFLESGLAQTVRLHAKPQPFFVSDATPDDVAAALTFLTDEAKPAAAALGRRLRAQQAAGRLSLTTDPFWVMPFPMWHMPAGLYQELAAASLLISKGDLNYRRWLGDRRWPLTTPLVDIAGYAPAPLLALRTLKSDVGAGLPADRLPDLYATDPNWLTNGRYGVLQYVNISETLL